ncbi:uncharacterized protein FJT64_024775 [Amphibalanus amphitrite]|uniref:RNA-directed DNA polymerase n=1 Tax=Amphibalanus amphitrite TaxID=1232801 RepID=A0A6A4WMN2_AMPAM|nr:uncharacterized protein FJT64_024775 [Amphibalanus amphitrite]
MNVEGVSPPTPFLARPGKPALPWSDWIFSFHNYLTALGGEAYSTERKTALLLHCVGAEAQRVYRTLPVQPRREDEDEFHAAERQLAEFYEPQVNVIAERFFFRQRRQESHEPTADYVAALRRLAVNCSFGQMTDAMIRDQVVEATVHPILRERFLQDKGLTLDRVLEIAEAFERSRREATAMAGPARPAADGAQMPVPAEEADLHEDSSAEEEVIALLTDEESVLTEQDVRTASAADPELQQLRHQIKRGWPSSAKACPVEVQPYFKMRHELWVRNDDVILRGAQQVVVPVQLRRRYLELAHSAHDGIVRMKQALRNLAWWPGINREVEELCRSCERCQHSDAVLSQRARPAPMQPVDLPDRAWSKLGMDIVGPINGAPATARYAITLIDYRSKWAEVCLTSSTETEDVIKFLSTVWAKEGYPDEIVTDNGPQFTSREFTAYLAARGVKHTKSSVYWPRGNSAVERFNKTFKSWITDCPPAAFIDEVRKSLAVYRATPHTTTGKSPSELLHGRQMRLNLPVIQPSTPGADSVASRVRRRQQSNKRSYDRRRGVTTPRITEGDYVCVRRQGHRSKTSCRFTSPVRVTGRVGPATYRLADGRIWNAAHLGPLTSLAAASRPSTETACEPSPDAADGARRAPPPAAPAQHWGAERRVLLRRHSASQALGISIVGGKVDLCAVTPGSTILSGVFIKNVLADSVAGRTAQLQVGPQ